MTWQDLLLSFGGLVLLLGLAQSILSPYKPPRLQSLLYALVLGSFGAVYFSYGSPCAAGIALAQSAGWGILVFQRRVVV